ncbi:MAG: hypothetical protein QOF76_550 [Solirubrobacteraceae bacterium]|jgi:aryl-alcohol dehydrogenase-like predicted oxidoreductase|nr:hypothetical protein [Solirubrobacteraceae bacterium]
MADLPTRTLGADGPEVGAIGLGCMGMSFAYSPGDRDDETSVAVIHRALDLGVTFIDTSDVYGPFHNEELVGQALAHRRDDAVLATKGGLVYAAGQVSRNGHPDHLREALDDSLKRLQTDYVDLYQLHRVDPAVPVEESWGVMADAVVAGKAKAIGMSEATVEELERAEAVYPVSSLQSELSLWTRGALADVLPWCVEHDAAFIPYAPLGRGFLTGQITAARFESSDFRARNPRFTAEAMAANLAIVDAVRAIAAKYDATPGQVALAWTLAVDELVVPIPGTKRLAYLEENAAAAGLELSPEDIATLDDLPAAVGDRY